MEHVSIVADHRNAVASLRDRFRLDSLPRTREQHHLGTISAKLRCHRAEAIVAPMFRTTEQTTGVDAEQRLLRIEAEGEKVLARGFADCGGKRDRRDLVDDARRAVHALWTQVMSDGGRGTARIVHAKGKR
jgi:hypothetical protein